MARKLGSRMGFFSVKDGKKVCTACKKEKDQEEFSKYKYTTNGGVRSTRIHSRCRPCQENQRSERRKSNPEKFKKQCQDWREKNKCWRKIYDQQYRKSDRGRAKRAEIQRIREKKLLVERRLLTKEEKEKINQIYINAKRMEQIISVCPVFDDPFLGRKVHVDHIIPLSRGGRHHPDNLQILLMSQNLRKNDKILNE